jgi:carbamoyl-phosphate synthase small subunit
MGFQLIKCLMSSRNKSPVKNLISGKGEITSQNHGFAVNKDELEANSDLEITHVHLNDGTVAGMRMKYKNCFSVQYHPEASPGPHDSSYLFDQFIQNLIGLRLFSFY